MKLKDTARQPLRASRELLNFLPIALPSLLLEMASEADLGQKFMKMFFILQSLQMDDFSLEMQAKAMPFLIRPIDTHAGENFEKIGSAKALADYGDKSNTADATRHLASSFPLAFRYMQCPHTVNQERPT